ncbi:phosphopentomutase [Desulfofundulus australicus DSM 11792]|uniref:Phosphopentomutase n=1 Tax=Desulfofundulus australicus DSM 11792 TaxID=1121425 RepID=A0A1M5AE93_9FIRM|nr:phosphopentomutase [Desulfofundulus australicus]SHF28484.1 phosphopentomutase [Desulfofundulus australicus DSM 11792]
MQAIINRLTLIVLDSVGIGELPDAEKYGDKGSNTLANTARAVGGLNLPNLGRLGLGNILAIEGVPPVKQPLAAYGRMAEASAGKDTTTGHWEIAGLLLERPFPVYPHGFPPEIIEPFEKRIGRPVLGNRAASGTAIIEELGEEHIKTGYPIVYTSADSVFQIAAHEEVIPVNELYGMCRVARELLTGPHAVGRVIARPFVGKPGAFKRTDRRRDFSLPPPAPTVLDLLTQNGFSVLAVGKIEDIFAGRGITEAIHTKDNMDGVDRTIACMRRLERGLIFTNLVDFDMLYGHRNNPRGYAAALEAFDRRLPEILSAVRPDEVLIITADHGCDPTTSSTDHSREYVPLLVYGPLVEPGVNLGTRSTFSDVAASVAEFFGLSYPRGTSFVREVVIR